MPSIRDQIQLIREDFPCLTDRERAMAHIIIEVMRWAQQGKHGKQVVITRLREIVGTESLDEVKGIDIIRRAIEALQEDKFVRIRRAQ